MRVRRLRPVDWGWQLFFACPGDHWPGAEPDRGGEVPAASAGFPPAGLGLMAAVQYNRLFLEAEPIFREQ